MQFITQILQFNEIPGYSKERLHQEGHSKQNGRQQHPSNIVEAVSGEKVWWSVRASDIYTSRNTMRE
jgi:hypothetical protein